jgi:hypothetical protein
VARSEVASLQSVMPQLRPRPPFFVSFLTGGRGKKTFGLCPSGFWLEPYWTTWVPGVRGRL